MTPMNIRAALLQAIVADPEDDATRFVYADWLEENGTADLARALRPAVLQRRGAADACQRMIVQRGKVWRSSLTPSSVT